MKLVADESVDGPIVARLRADGHVVAYVAEMEPSVGDERVLAIAQEHEALLLTADKDFGELVVRQRRVSHGVVLFRLEGAHPQEKASIASRVLAQRGPELRDAFTVVTRNSVRIRRPRTVGEI